MKILIGINTLTSVEQSVYSNHCQFWYRLGRKTDHEFIFVAPRRMNIDNMRNMAAKLAIAHECDYLLFIDDDVLVPMDTLQRLLDCKAGIAAGWTIIRGYPYKNMFFRWTDETQTNLEHYPEPVPIGQVLDVDAVGFSCCLIDVKLLKQVETPFFITGPFNTEDIYFCLKARTADPNCKIVVDTGVITQHQLDPDYISPLNVKQMRDYNEAFDPSLLTREEQKDTKEEQAQKIGNRTNATYEQLMNQIMFKGRVVAQGIPIK